MNYYNLFIVSILACSALTQEGVALTSNAVKTSEKKSYNLRERQLQDGMSDSCAMFMMQVGSETDQLSMEFDEDTVVSHLCNGVARHRTLEQYVQAQSNTNPCLMELVRQVDASDVNFLSILGDQATCEDAMHESFDTRMMEEGDPTRKLFWRKALRDLIIALANRYI